MPDPRLSPDPAVRSLAVGLVSYLREYLLKLQPDRVRDGVTGAKVFWLANLRSRLSVSGFDLPCPPSAGAPAPPSRVRRLLVDEEAWRNVDGAEPSLSAAADDVAREQYDRWFPDWQRWAAEEEANKQLRADYAALDDLRRGADDRGDTHELVLGVGLLTAAMGGRRTVRRHLLVCDVTITVDPATEMLHVALPTTPDWRAEDREFLDSADGFRQGGSGVAMPVGMRPDEVGDWLQEWRRRSWDTDLALEADQWTPEDGDGVVAKLALAPALILRPRSQSGLLRMYEAIAAQLNQRDEPVPFGLANLVAPTTAAHPTELASSGLYPLASNREQRRVLEKLRTDSAVVVQGPPGRG
jgi:hypothetical protein